MRVPLAVFRLARAVIPLALVAAGLGSCRAPQTTGDARGGVIDWFTATKGQVEDAASAHCRRHGKAARITRTDSGKGGGEAVFICE